MSPLTAGEAYRLWAPNYSSETAVSFLENKLVGEMTPPLDGLCLLDAGCGTGRRIRNAGSAKAVGLEVCPEMLAAGAAEGSFAGIDFVVGDVRQMPFDAGAFDVIWCRLVLGHLPEIANAYAELARVAHDSSTLIVSDFHPAAVDAGHRRNFRLGDKVIEVEHHVHRVDDHIKSARAAGLELRQVREAEIGNDVLPFYASAHRLEALAEHVGLPVVIAMAFGKVR
jgi:malonyl-CoA O-methyltransferase